MKIFIGGASEDSQTLREIESWVAENGHEAWPWDEPGTFTIGSSTFHRLIDISRQVQAAILIFSPVDRVHYRGGTTGQPRDNVLIEYGLFSSALGPEKCAIALVGDGRVPSDLAGISALDFRGSRKPRGRIELSLWLKSLASHPIDPAVAVQMARKETLPEAATGTPAHQRDVTFTVKHEPDAATVELWGDFNDWKSGIKMSRTGQSFEVVLSLSTGRHEFKFKVDGVWRDEMREEYDTAPNAAGGQNYVIRVG